MLLNTQFIKNYGFEEMKEKIIERLDDFTLLKGLFEAGEYLNPFKKGGAHTEVFKFNENKLHHVMKEWNSILRTQKNDEEIKKLSQHISKRFILKVGNIENFSMKLFRKRESLIKRNLVSEAFGPVGFNVFPTIEKVRRDTAEAVRQIPYFGSGGEEEQFAPDILEGIRNFFTGNNKNFYFAKPDGSFLIFEKGKKINVYKILKDDPYFREEIRNFRELRQFQSFIRKNPVNSLMEERLAGFFDAPITVGFRDTLRWIFGSRHPSFSWKNASMIIKHCSKKYGSENFFSPEINYYTIYPGLPKEDVNKKTQKNYETIIALSKRLFSLLPVDLRNKIDEEGYLKISASILEFHHQYPLYKIEPYSGVLSVATLTLLVRFFFYLFIHLSQIDLPQRRNIPSSDFLDDSNFSSIFSRVKRDEKKIIYEKIIECLLEYLQRGGVKREDGKIVQYEFIPTTFYSFQERIPYRASQKGNVLWTYSLESLWQKEKREIFHNYPEIGEKLLLFFTLAYRYFLDTGFSPDLRPESIVKDLLILGIWGYKTENVLITLYERNDRSIGVEIKLVDNKDQFKQYRRAEDRENPLGIAKYGLRLMYPIVQPALERAIGIFSSIIEENTYGKNKKKQEFKESVEKLSDILNKFLREWVDGILIHSQAFFHDTIDDLTDAFKRGAGKFLSFRF